LRGDVPASWYRLLAIAVEASCRRAGTEPTAEITLMQCKEKFGELRLLFDVEGSTELKSDIETITTWARRQSTSVCAAYGTPAWMTRDGWIIPLSKEAIALRARDRMAFRGGGSGPSRSARQWRWSDRDRMTRVAVSAGSAHGKPIDRLSNR
jgi:hypothetical protein